MADSEAKDGGGVCALGVPSSESDPSRLSMRASARPPEPPPSPTWRRAARVRREPPRQECRSARAETRREAMGAQRVAIDFGVDNDPELHDIDTHRGSEFTRAGV